MPAPRPASVTKEKLVLRAVSLDFDKATIRPDARPVLDEAARALSRISTARISVEGHTDTVGSDAYNTRLSERRSRGAPTIWCRQGLNSSTSRRTVSVSRNRWPTTRPRTDVPAIGASSCAFCVTRRTSDPVSASGRTPVLSAATGDGLLDAAQDRAAHPTLREPIADLSYPSRDHASMVTANDQCLVKAK